MTPSIFLDQKETKKVADKSSMVYKTLMTLLRTLREKTGMKVSVIGTDAKGNLFELDIHDDVASRSIISRFLG